jgi:hypothetical protein
MKWHITVKFNRRSDVILFQIREQLRFFGVEVWWIPKLGY